MNIKKYWIAIFGLTVVGFFVANKTLKENFRYIYRNSSLQTGLKLQSVTVGLELENELNFPHPPAEIDYFNQTLIYNAIPRSFAVTDLNQDSFVDICTFRPFYERQISCFVNEGGKHFVDVTEKLGLGKKSEWIASVIYSADFNNDGLADLLVVKYGRHQLLLRDLKKGFIEVENDWFSNAWGANFADFNGDGLLDVVFANYYARLDLNKNLVPWNFKGLSDTNGDFNEVWINKGNGKFAVDKKIFSYNYKDHSTSVGIADFNRDGTIKIFVGNDYAIDRMYVWDQQAKEFTEATTRLISPLYHGYSGMNTEFFDFNKDGFLDFYVSNITIPPLLGNSNIMWIWSPEENRFNQRAKAIGVDRCGYAWTAKSVDFNLDGENEIISASGFYSAEEGKVNLLFYRLMDQATAEWFPKSPPPQNVRDFSISINARPCLFFKSQETYADVSESVIDWNTSRASRLLVTLDYNNDGKMDLIIPEHGGITRTYVNQTETKNNWLGLLFVNKQGSRINFGVKAEVVDGDGKLLEYFELNPANGFKSQNDYRKIVGLGGRDRAGLKVFLKDGKVLSFNLKVNEYNEIKIF